MDSLLMSIASTLFCFDITKAKHAEGRNIEPDIRWDPGFTRHIVPFKCCIAPRSAEAAKLVQDSEFT
ncbi:monooxygenase activity protein [Pleurotus ostreatus]|nr:monooxygenase activity protein [Pleurotus ostreatus]